MARGTKPVPTVLQQKAIDGMKAVILGRDNKSFVQVLRDAGYSPESARQWKNIMDGLRPHLQPTLDWLEVHRARVMTRMDEKLDFASYDELRKSLASLTEAKQILGGKPTQNIAISAEFRHRLDRLIE